MLVANGVLSNNSKRELFSARACTHLGKQKKDGLCPTAQSFFRRSPSETFRADGIRVIQVTNSSGGNVVLYFEFSDESETQ